MFFKKYFNCQYAYNKASDMCKPGNTSLSRRPLTDDAINKLNYYPESNHEYSRQPDNLNEETQEYEGMHPGTREQKYIGPENA